MSRSRPDHAPKGRIHVVGAAHMDRAGRCAASPRLGQSNPGRFTETPGGAAFNAASVLAALGARVRLGSIVGNDGAADIVRAAARRRGIEADFQVSPSAPTASYTSILAPDGALVVALADMAIYEQFRADNMRGGSDPAAAGDWLLVDANLPPREIEMLLRRAPGRRAAMTVSAAKAARLRPLLGDIEMLFTNRAELAALCDGDPAAPVEANLRAFPGRGAVVSDGAGDVWSFESGAIRRHAVPPVSAIADVTGAGDALAGGCLAALMSGETLEAAIRRGVRAAQAVLAVDGPWRADLLLATSADPEADA